MWNVPLKSQSASQLWFRFRSGRITASRTKTACRSNPDQPSISLIRSICHHEAASFATAATKWGCGHDDLAVKEYASSKMRTCVTVNDDSEKFCHKKDQRGCMDHPFKEAFIFRWTRYVVLWHSFQECNSCQESYTGHSFIMHRSGVFCPCKIC